VWLALGAALLLAASVPSAQNSPQQAALIRGMDHEGKGQFRDAAQQYRVAMASSEHYEVALLGFERAMHELGLIDSLLIVTDSIAKVRPDERVVRTIQLRGLLALGRNRELRGVFESWRGAAPSDPSPYREYARILIDGGRVADADTLLRLAATALPDTRLLALELAQVRAALGMWEAAAQAWRQAVDDADYLERAAFISLAATPATERTLVREVFMNPPITAAARKTIASLDLNWGLPRQAWSALSDLPRSDSSRAAWLDFAERAEAAEAWLPARDALLAALAIAREPEVAARAARAAVSGGDAAGAIALVQSETRLMQQRDAARWFGVVHVRALASLGHAGEAEQTAAGYSRLVESGIRGQLQHEVAWGWIRTGDVARARTALAQGADENETGEISGWIALYSGDLRTARSQLRGYGDGARFPGTITAMSVLTRVRNDSSKKLGEAFLALARADSTGTAQGFQAAAEELPEAASLLLMTAARFLLPRDTSASVRLWQVVVEKHPTSPEAAEADLEWARVLRVRGDRAGSIARLEHMILSYPTSALLPQARRELELLRGRLSPVAGGSE
jgi:tetratricopeptide (TPR) repeat protein